MNNFWKKNNKNLLSKICNSLNGVYYFITDDTFKIISIFTLIYIILTINYIKNIETKCIFVIFGILMFCFEMLNSIIETIVDRISLEKNELSKKIKDMSSGLVTIYIISTYCALIYRINKY